jgi:type I restriction enzyme S subunit
MAEPSPEKEIEGAYVVPDGWVWCKLGDVCEINPKSTNLSDFDQSLPTTFVPMTAVDQIEGTIKTPEILPLGKARKGHTQFIENDVIFARITPCMENGKVAIAKNLENYLGFGSTEFHVIRPPDEIIPEYIFYFIRPVSFRNKASAYFTSTVGQMRVPKAFMLAASFPLPPLPEQHRIVTKLETLLAQVDRSKDHLAKVPPLIKRFRQSVLAAACSGRLTEDWRREHPNVEPARKIIEVISQRRQKQANTPTKKQKIKDIYSHREEQDLDLLPQSWEYAAIDKLCESFQYGSSKKSMPVGKIPVLRMGNIQNGEIDWNDLVYTSDEAEIEKYRLEPETVLFNRTNSPELVGKTAIYRGERPAIFAGYLIRINNYGELDSEYLNYCLNTTQTKERCLRVKADGVSQSNINAQKLGKFEIPFCSFAEQQEIVRRVNTLLDIIKSVEERYQKAHAHLEKLTQSIPAKAFRGELVPQDPNDEPASVLLERIKQERAKNEKGNEKAPFGCKSIVARAKHWMVPIS